MAFRIACFLILCSHAFATSIIFILSPNNLVVGADSKSYDFYGRPKPNACKIVPGPHSFVFASAGPLEDGNGRFASVARAVMADAKNLSDAATRFDTLVQPRLQSLAVRVRKAKPDYYAAFMEGKPWFQTAFAQVDAAGPRIMVRTYKPVVSGGHIALLTADSDCLKNCAGIHVGLGYFDNMDRALAGSNMPVRSLTQTIRNLIGLEVEAHPDKVGPPVAILTADANGTHWLESGACQF